jgi:putative transposase
MMLSEGHMSDHSGAALMLNALPRARVLIGDKGYDNNRFRQALTARGI